MKIHNDPWKNVTLHSFFGTKNNETEYYTPEHGLLLKWSFHIPNLDRIMVSRVLAQRIVRAYRDDRCHFGYGNTYAMICKNYFWDKMQSDIRNHVRNLIVYHARKQGGHISPAKIMMYICLKLLRHIFAVELVWPLPRTPERYTNICTSMGTYSRFLVAY